MHMYHIVQFSVAYLVSDLVVKTLVRQEERLEEEEREEEEEEGGEEEERR